MMLRIGWWTALGLLLAAFPMEGQVGCPSIGRAMAQTGPWRGSPTGPHRAAGPDQPVVPGYPTVQRRPAPQPPPPAPFGLTPYEEAALDRVLNAWQQRSAKVKTFACNFTRWEYDPVFGDPNKPRYIDQGKIRYRAPDRGMFQVEKPKEREERWICDGKSIYEYNFASKQVIQHKLPPELQGKAIVESPLPFLFGAEANKLKQRYFLRIITPQDVQHEQTWLEAYPRFQQDAANFKRAELILANETLMAYALQIHSPNGQNRTVYQFHDIVINDPLGFLKGNPFHPFTPLGWKNVVDEVPAAEVSRQPARVGRQ